MAFQKKTIDLIRAFSGRPPRRATRDRVRALNHKALASELARPRLQAHTPVAQPSIVNLGSKPCTQADMDASWARYWNEQFGEAPNYHRAAWENAFVAQALYEEGLLIPGARFLALDAQDIPSNYIRGLGCIVNDAGLGPSLRVADLSHLPINAGYDGFLSRSGASLAGGPERAAEFIRRSAQTLRAGGRALHTFDFAYSGDEIVGRDGKTFAFRAAEIEAIANTLQGMGYSVAPLSFDTGADVFDRYVDIPPFKPSRSDDQWWNGARPPHLKALIGGARITSYGLIITREI